MGVKPDRALAVRIASSKDEAVATWRWFTVTSHVSSRRHLKILKGEKVPPKVVLPAVQVTKENIDSMRPACELRKQRARAVIRFCDRASGGRDTTLDRVQTWTFE